MTAPLVIECPRCYADIPARRTVHVKATCLACGRRVEVHMEKENR